MGKTTKTKNQKKSRLNANHVAEETYTNVPHSFVFNRGQVGKNAGQLVQDMRRVMGPFTAENLKVRKKNSLKDFVSVAGPLGVTHFMIFGKTPTNVNMRLARLPKGPMLYFKVAKYALIKDVISSLKKHRMHDQQFGHHPLLVLNNFGSDGMQVKLMATMFQHMFPSINVHKISLNSIKRCVLLNYNPETQEIEFRHYSLKVVPVGISRGVKKLMQERFPNMNKFEDISELLMKGANLSESEAEQDGDHNITELPQVYSGRGNMASQQSAVRLTEIGPRMTLQLVKIQEGIGEGNIMYHSFISKTEEEIQEILKRKELQLKAKSERRSKQEEDIAQKEQQREENKKKSIAGMKRKQQPEEEEDSEVEDPGVQTDKVVVSSDDEVEYYRQAVGKEPEEGMFSGTKRHQSGKPPGGPFKKRRPSPGGPAESPGEQKFAKSHQGHSPGGQRRDRPGGNRNTMGRGEQRPGGRGRPGERPGGRGRPGERPGGRGRPGERPGGRGRPGERPGGRGRGGPRRDKMGPGEQKYTASPHRRPGGLHRDRPGGDRDGKGGKRFGDGGKRFGAKKTGDGDKRFGGKKPFQGKNKFGKKNTDGGFKSKGPKGKPPGNKKRGPGGGGKQRKGKG